MLQLLDASSVSPRKHREPTGVEIVTRGAERPVHVCCFRLVWRGSVRRGVLPPCSQSFSSHSLWVRWRERTTPRSCEAGQPSFARRTPPELTDSPCIPRPRCHRGGAAPLTAPGGCRHGSHRRRPGRAHRRNRGRGPASRGGAGRRRAPRVPRRPSLQRRSRPEGTAAGRAPASNAYLASVTDTAPEPCAPGSSLTARSAGTRCHDHDPLRAPPTRWRKSSPPGSRPRSGSPRSIRA